MQPGILHRNSSSRLPVPCDHHLSFKRSASYHGYTVLPVTANYSNIRGKFSESPFERELKDVILSFKQYLGITTSESATLSSLDEVLYDTLEVLRTRYPKCLSSVQVSGIGVSTRQSLLHLYKVLKFVKDSWKGTYHCIHIDKLHSDEDTSLDTSTVEQIGECVCKMLKAASSPKIGEMFESSEMSIDENSTRAGKKRKIDRAKAGTEPNSVPAEVTGASSNRTDFPKKKLSPILTRQRHQSLAVLTPSLPYAFIPLPANPNHSSSPKFIDDGKDDMLDEILTTDFGVVNYTGKTGEDSKNEHIPLEEDITPTSKTPSNSIFVMPGTNKMESQGTHVSSQAFRLFLTVDRTPTPPSSPIYLESPRGYVRSSAGKLEMARHIPLAMILDNITMFSENDETDPLEISNANDNLSSPMIIETPVILELAPPMQLDLNQPSADPSSQSKALASTSAPLQPTLPPLPSLKIRAALPYSMSPKTVLLPPSPREPPSSPLHPRDLTETPPLSPSTLKVSVAEIRLPSPFASVMPSLPPLPPSDKAPLLQEILVPSPSGGSFCIKDAPRPTSRAPPPPPLPPIKVARLAPGRASPPPLPAPGGAQKKPTPPPPPPGGSQKGLTPPLLPPTPPPPPAGAPLSPSPLPVGTPKGFAPPPPPPPGRGGVPPPPPPGNAARELRPKNTKLKRSSQMGNLYRLLKVKVEGSSLNGKRSLGRKSQVASSGNKGQGMADALAEMTKRSSYFQQIEEDVEKYSKSILKLNGEISSFQTKDMAELVKFHKHVEQSLECLTDETQVLARFDGFPSKKLESLRMAAALYSKLEGMVSTLKGWKLSAPILQQLDKIEAYFNKIKEDVDGIDRIKDEENKRYKSHNIEFDFSILLRIKEATVDLSSNCIELARKESKEAKEQPITPTARGKNQQGSSTSKLLWRAFQFAFRVYNFAGGQDERADRLTAELAHEIETIPN